MAITQDGKYIASGSADSRVCLWDSATGKEIRTFKGHAGGVSSVALTADGKYLVSGSWDKTVRLWDLNTGREIRTFKGHVEGVNSVALSGDGKYLVSGSYDKTVRLWDLNTGREIRTLGHADGVRSVALSADGKYLVSGSMDKTIRLWDLKTGKEIRTFSWDIFAPPLDLCKKGKYLVAGSLGCTVHLLRLKSGKKIRTFTGHTAAVLSVALSADGQHLVSGSYDYVRLWDLKTGKEIRTFNGHTEGVTSVALSADGQYLVSGGMDNTVRLWELNTGREIRVFSGHNFSINFVALGVDRQYLISGSEDKTVRLWDLKTGKQIRTFKVVVEGVTSVALSGDGQTLVSVIRDKTVRLWDVKTGKEIRTFKVDVEGFPYDVALSGDGQTLVTGRESWSRSTGIRYTMRIWDVKTGKKIRTIVWHELLVAFMALSGDGQTLVSGNEDKTVRLWDVKTGTEIYTFKGHAEGVTSVALGAEGKYLVSGSWDKTVRLWDLNTGREIRTFKGHTSGVTSVALSVDSNYMVSGSRDGEIKTWDLKTGYLLISLVPFKDNEWVTYTPDNYYICSPGGEKYVSFRKRNTIYGPEMYSQSFKNAEVIANKLQITNVQTTTVEKTKPVDTQPIDINITSSNEPTTIKTPGSIQPPTVVINYFKCKDKLIEEENPMVESPEVEVNATVLDNQYGLKKIIITVNNITLSEKILSGKSYKLKQTIALSDSMNHIKIIAFNTKDIQGVEEKVIAYQKTTSKSSPLQQMVKSIFGKKRSWAVLIGIKDYTLQRNGMKPLPYALNDVRSMKNYLITGLDFDKNNIKTLIDSRATREEIVKELGENIPGRVGTGDRVLVYFSGHGGKEIIRTDDGDKTFSYLIPYDGKQNSLFSTGISMEVLSRLSERIPAKQVLFIIDACFSGNIGQIIKKSSIYPKETRKEIETFIKNKGREVMTAGTMDEEAMMGDKWNNHSVYTFYLLKGLRGGADYNKNKVITTTELQQYLENYVPKEANQTPLRFHLPGSRGGQFVFYREGED
ncbi:MAG: hypothetical protein GTN53_44300 [Candidatus Aminicenantes bacterium]|nr:hypothetical protein [Candidatus Aminicenantes bacterium]NIT29531.1 hypothetical protein [Candidatus Aminicenantes bacterium]